MDKMHKKGVSVMIGYIILVSIALVMASIIYYWIRNYVPVAPLECPDGSSIFIKSVKYNCSSELINISLKNNGRFNLGGYFIHASNVSEQELAVLDLTQYFLDSEPPGDGIKLNSGIKFHSSGENTVPPNNQVTHFFNLSGSGIIYSLEITPFRYQTEGSKTRLVSCSNARVKYKIVCD